MMPGTESGLFLSYVATYEGAATYRGPLPVPRVHCEFCKGNEGEEEKLVASVFP